MSSSTARETPSRWVRASDGRVSSALLTLRTLLLQAQNDLHCTEMAGKLITVAPDAIRRPSASDNAYGSKLSARAPTFVPTFAPAQGQETTTATALPGAIDPCNLFIKNLCPSIDNSELFALFKPFGHITSARVMRDDNGKSREFGFVSFTTPESAANALRSLDAQQAGSKNMTVRVHEPKSFREQKLARIFSGDSNSSRGSPGSPRSPISPHATNKGSYFSSSSPRNTTAAAAHSGDTSTSSTADTSIGSSTSGAFDEIELSRMEPAERDDIIMTEFIKRARELPGSNDADVLTVVRGLVECTLTDQIRALNDQRTFERLAAQVKEGMAGEKEVKEKDDAKTPKPATAKLPAEDAPAAADGKESKGSPEPPKNGATSSPSTDAAAASSSPKTERERLGEAVAKLLPEASSSSVNDIADLLAGLPKKERAMALFNGDYLKTKVDEAKAILEMAGDDEEKVADAKKNGAQSGAGKEAATANPAAAPAASEPAPSAPAAAQPSSSTPSQTHTLSSLALLPCAEIVSLATSPTPPSPLPPINPTTWRQTDEMMDRILAEKREAEQKQKLGDVLFKKIKSFGIKGAPKVTIKLLDEEDLRSLAHVAESFEVVLREKVQGLVEGMKKV